MLIAVFSLVQDSVVHGFDVGLYLSIVSASAVQSFETLEIGGGHGVHIVHLNGRYKIMC